MRRLALLLLAALAPCGLVFAQLSPNVGLYREDSAAADGTWLIGIGVVRKDVATGLCGADGEWCHLQVDSTGSLRVVFSNTGLATAANQTTEIGHLATLASTFETDGIAADRLAVNLIIGQFGVEGGSGISSAKTVRVVPASDVSAPIPTVAAANQPGACVTVDTSSDAILASNANRRGFTLQNNGSVTFLLKLGATATTSNGAIPPGAGFSMTSGAIYTGAVDGITASSSTSVCAWEW